MSRLHLGQRIGERPLGRRAAPPVKKLVMRIAIARAILKDAPILLLDEATSALDPATTEQILDLLKLINQTTGVTVVLITHDLDTIVAMATRIAVLADKRIISYATLDETLQVKHPFIERFFDGAQGRRALARNGAED